MAKYHYDKSAIKGLDTKAFMNQVKVRQNHIAEAGTEIPTSIYQPNRLAGSLHPEYLLGRIKTVNPMGPAVKYVIEPYVEGGFTEFPNFKAGQYLSFEFDLGEKYACRTYCISCSPKCALGSENNTYEIIVASTPSPGFHISAYIHEHWDVGTIVCFSSPLGHACYEPLRDAKNVLSIGIGGYNLSMAEAIADGIEDFKLTLLNIAKNPNTIIERNRFLDAAVKSDGKVKYYPVLMEGSYYGCEKGPVTEDLIKKNIIDKKGEWIDTTFFIAGPDFMVDDLEHTLKSLGITQKRIRKEYMSEVMFPFKASDYPKEAFEQSYQLRVWIHGEYQDLTCYADKSLLCVMENAGIRVMSDCRSGFCGWCHSRKISGDYYMPESHDGRREADRKFGWIHPCCTYPLSDMEIEVFPMM